MAVVLYGATGYTGRLVTRELVRRDLDFVLAGRDEQKLRRLSASEGRGAPIVAAPVDDPPALRALFDGCEVVINCAGPFSLIGEPVLRAAIDAGAHYVDSTGEQNWMRTVFERYGEEAERRGIALIPACGFDYAPGDCLARVVAEGAEPLEELDLHYAVTGVGLTHGTMLSVLEMMATTHLEYAGGHWRPIARRVVRERFEFPPPFGTLTVGMYPSGEQLTVPRHTRVRTVKTRLSTATLAPGPLGETMPFLMPALALGMRKPVRRVMERVVKRLPEGPSEDKRRGARFVIVATARGEDGSLSRAIARGSDVYGLTAVTLVQAAELLGRPGHERAGAIGPAAAFDAVQFLNHLTDHSLSWERSPAPVAV